MDTRLLLSPSFSPFSTFFTLVASALLTPPAAACNFDVHPASAFTSFSPDHRFVSLLLYLPTDSSFCKVQGPPAAASVSARVLLTPPVEVFTLFTLLPLFTVSPFHLFTLFPVHNLTFTLFTLLPLFTVSPFHPCPRSQFNLLQTFSYLSTSRLSPFNISPCGLPIPCPWTPGFCFHLHQGTSSPSYPPEAYYHRST